VSCPSQMGWGGRTRSLQAAVSAFESIVEEAAAAAAAVPALLSMSAEGHAEGPQARRSSSCCANSSSSGCSACAASMTLPAPSVTSTTSSSSMLGSRFNYGSPARASVSAVAAASPPMLIRSTSAAVVVVGGGGSSANAPSHSGRSMRTLDLSELDVSSGDVDPDLAPVCARHDTPARQCAAAASAAARCPPLPASSCFSAPLALTQVRWVSAFCLSASRSVTANCLRCSARVSDPPPPLLLSFLPSFLPVYTPRSLRSARAMATALRCLLQRLRSGRRPPRPLAMSSP
jgi:hypothetical protein